MLMQLRGDCECKVNSTKCESPLPHNEYSALCSLCLPATVNINIEGGICKMAFL